MKHFFFESCKDLKTLLNFDNKLQEDTDTDNIEIRKLKRIYDAADVIYDRRIDPIASGENDSDLLELFDATKSNESGLLDAIRNTPENCIIQEENSNYSAEEMTSSAKKPTDSAEKPTSKCFTPQIKYGLLSLWNYIADDWQRATTCNQLQDKPELLFYYYLAAGNIARRLSQSFLLIDNNFRESEKWGERAFELVWHSKKIAKKQCDEESNPSEGKSESWQILWLLSEYNMGTCLQDYTNRNRRSNYASAEDQYRIVRVQIENDDSLVKNATPLQRRQLFLIYTETLRHQVTIQRRQRKKDETLSNARALARMLLNEVKNTQDDDSLSTVIRTFAESFDEKICGLSFDKLSEEPKSESVLRNLLGRDPAFTVHSYSFRRSLLLMILDLSRCYSNNCYYKEALWLAFAASQLSNDLDGNCTSTGQLNEEVINLDALILLSASLRKDYRHNGEISDNPYRKSSAYGNVFRSIGSLFVKLKGYADSKHLESKYELLKWYCMFQESSRLKQVLDSENDGWLDDKTYLAIFTPVEINALLSNTPENPRLLYFQGKIELHTNRYEDAVKTFSKLLTTYPEYTNYIRPGTLGLKARYLLANAYMNLIEYGKAMEILRGLFDTLKRLGKMECDYSNMRILVDLAYCYIKRGDYCNALDLYLDTFPPVVKLGCSVAEMSIRRYEKACMFLKELKKTYLELDRKDYIERYVEPLLQNCVLHLEDSKAAVSSSSARSATDNHAALDTSDKEVHVLFPQIIAAVDRELERITSGEDENATKNRIKKVIDAFSNPNDSFRSKIVNNLWNSLLFVALDDSKSGLNKQMLHAALILFRWITREEIGDDLLSDPETNYLFGLFVILTRKTRDELLNEPIQSILQEIQNSDKTKEKGFPLDALADALDCFRIACEFNIGFVPQYTPWEIGGSTVVDTEKAERAADKGRLFNKMTYISAYLINLVQLASSLKLKIDSHEGELQGITERIEEYNKCCLEIKQFIEGIPKKYAISMKAAISLAEWLIAYYEENKSSKSEIDRLYRSFSFVTIYEERGAAPFNELRTDPAFRLIGSDNRGRILAHLLVMYKPINELKEMCTYSIEDRRQSQKKEMHLVQYTKLSRLKELLCEGYDESKPGYTAYDENKNEQASKKPRLRLSNCAYVNDISEGRRFFERMENAVIANEETASAHEKIDLLKETYFHQLKRDENEMLPSADDIYTASLSVSEDSFPMWSIYGDKEAGCNIEFAEEFFDIKGGVHFYPNRLRDLLPSRYIDSDYPLYIVQYISKKIENDEKLENINEEFLEQTENDSVTRVMQHCRTRGVPRKKIDDFLTDIYNAWRKLDKLLDDIHLNEDERSPIIRFAADRINEVRFLFKDPDYEYEAELRVVYTDKPEKRQGRLNFSLDLPHQYVPMEREITDLTIRLGSKVSDSDVDRIVSWLYHTKRVKKVLLSKRNRYVGEFPG